MEYNRIPIICKGMPAELLEELEWGIEEEGLFSRRTDADIETAINNLYEIVVEAGEKAYIYNKKDLARPLIAFAAETAEEARLAGNNVARLVKTLPFV